jgi:hypothetical protein
MKWKRENKMIKTVKYKSRADSNKTYEMPQDSVKQTDHIMKVILKTKDPNDLVKRINEHSYFGNINLFTREDLLSTAKKIVETEQGTRESFKLVDEFYIKTGIYESYKIMEKAKAMNESLTNSLDESYGMLEREKK